MSTAEAFLKQQLAIRTDTGLLRELRMVCLPFDFCSNDYLGFARSSVLKKMITAELRKIDGIKNGSTGSRLISGNHPYTEETERSISAFHEAEAGLIFNSGYEANIGLISSIAQRGDTIITDELIHASIIDGARLSKAQRFKFRHNDIADLETKLKSAKGLIFVVVESVYSMDGDLAPLLAIQSLCKRYHANLIVDEAHATGVLGPSGKGLVVELGLQNEIFARVVTFGKAVGAHGAIVLGSTSLRDYLINFARSFIYTTAAPLHNLVTVNCGYRLLSDGDSTQKLGKKIKLYNTLKEGLSLPAIPSISAIQTLLFEDGSSARAAAEQLNKHGFDVKAILSPTVPAGKERLRICLHSYNSDKQIRDLIVHLSQIK